MIEAEGICRSYRGKSVLSALDLKVEKGEIFCIVGPNGAGKTTLLRILDLIDYPDRGSLRIFGEDVISSGEVRFRVRRRMAMLFQRPVILDSSVFWNVALGLRYRGVSADETERRVEDALALVDLQEHRARRARELSGGEIQRLALARAIVTEPEILFLDEPAANLDPRSAEVMEQVILALARERGTTIILSTHDLHQGERLADRMGVLLEGRFRQLGDAMEIFYRPASMDVARFIGFENILKGEVRAWESGEALVEVNGIRMLAIAPDRPEGEVFVCFRAEHVTVGVGEGPRTSARNRFRGRIVRSASFGPFVYLTIDCGFALKALLTRRALEELGLVEGSEVWATVKATSLRVFAMEGCHDRAKVTEKD